MSGHSRTSQTSLETPPAGTERPSSPSGAPALPAGGPQGASLQGHPQATAWLCATCGVQFARSARPPARCPICEDERQYVGPRGQEWTTLTELQRHHHNEVTLEEPGLMSIRTAPSFAIGQRALLVETPEGNVLWDCVSLIDEATVEALRARGGVSALAISHPHFYASMVEWSHAFGGAPIWVHEADRQWIMRPDDTVRTWSGASKRLPGGLSLVHAGGHFEGAQVLHWPQGAWSGTAPSPPWSPWRPSSAPYRAPVSRAGGRGKAARQASDGTATPLDLPPRSSSDSLEIPAVQHRPARQPGSMCAEGVSRGRLSPGRWQGRARRSPRVRRTTGLDAGASTLAL
jgi:hypothetical protein